MSKEIWVVLEHRSGKLKKPALEAVAVARKLAGSCGASVSALLLGSGAGALAAQAGPWGADRVLHVDDPNLAAYSAGPWSDVVATMARAAEPMAILASATPTGRDLAPRLAARLGAGYAADCVDVSADGQGLITARRPVYAGKLVATVAFREPRLQVLTLRPKVFDVAPVAAPGVVQAQVVHPTPASLKTVVREFVAKGGARPELTEADVIVTGGRGLKSAEGFKLLEELADVLGGSIGASRAAVDAGFRDHSAQVGQTGKVVNPKLYIACGLAGSIQHLVGMQGSKFILAVNKDPEAPIFKKADFGIVGDLFQVVPLLTAEFKKLLS